MLYYVYLLRLPRKSTSSQAIKSLDNLLREKIGTSRSRSKPLPIAERNFNMLQEQWVALQTHHKNVATRLQQLAQIEEGFDRLIEKEKRLNINTY